MSFFAIAPCFVIAAMLHIYNLNYFEKWYEFKAQVNQIERVKSRKGASFSIDFETISEDKNPLQIRKFNKNYNLGTREKSIFFSKTAKNSIIEIWINSEDNAVDVTEPERPNFFFILYILLPTLGLILLAAGAFIFGEKVVYNKELKPTNGF